MKRGWGILESVSTRMVKSKTQRTLSEVMKMAVRVGKEAPNFSLTAFHEGASKQITLTDYRGKWVMLCFYPADFTCV